MTTTRRERPPSAEAVRPTLVRALLVVLLLLPAVARAQHEHHHHEEGGSPDAVVVVGGVGGSVGQVTYGGEAFRFDTLAVMAAAQWRSLMFMAHLTYHQIDFPGANARGLGDPHLEIGWVTNLQERFTAGVTAAAMLPVGDFDRGLGMGHVMLMPAVIGSARLERWLINARLGWSGAVGGSHHHDYAWPLVAPMNGNQLELGGEVSVVVWPQLRTGISASLAKPIGDGVPLGDAAARAAWQLGRTVIGATVGRGLLDNPIGVHAGLDLSASF